MHCKICNIILIKIQTKTITMTNIILVFNIRQSVYRQFDLSLFQHANAKFNFHLLPIITLASDGIQQRASKLQKQVPKLLQKIKANNAHFACYSSSGIDFRFAVHELGLEKYVKTLTTISSPHKGSKLALLSDRKFFRDDLIDPVSKLTGVGLSAFHQFVPQNMKHFNNCIKNSQNIEYYSLGSEQLPNLCSYALSETGKYLTYKTETNYQYFNDGVFGHDEIVWGNHVTNFEADHGEVIGMYGKKDYSALKTVKEIAEDWETRNQKKSNPQKSQQQKLKLREEKQKVSQSA